MTLKLVEDLRRIAERIMGTHPEEAETLQTHADEWADRDIGAEDRAAYTEPPLGEQIGLDEATAQVAAAGPADETLFAENPVPEPTPAETAPPAGAVIEDAVPPDAAPTPETQPEPVPAASPPAP